MKYFAHYDDIASALTSVLSDRKKANSSYSLRAFARDLGLGSSTLSELMNGKKGLSPAKAKQVAERLRLSANETDYFLLLAENQSRRNSKSLLRARQALIDEKNRRTLTLEVFELISNWRHFAVLESLQDSRNQKRPQRIASGISLQGAELAEIIERLKKLSLLDDRLKPTNRQVSTPQDLPSRAIQEHHRCLLQQAQDALEQPVDERDFQSSFLMLATDRLPELKDRIRRFREEILSEFAANDAAKAELFYLGSQVFKISQFLEEGT